MNTRITSLEDRIESRLSSLEEKITSNHDILLSKKITEAEKVSHEALSTAKNNEVLINSINNDKEEMKKEIISQMKEEIIIQIKNQMQQEILRHRIMRIANKHPQF